MNPLASVVSTAAIALIYRIWELYRDSQRQRDRVLRQRVAYMLWVAADTVRPT